MKCFEYGPCLNIDKTFLNVFKFSKQEDTKFVVIFPSFFRKYSRQFLFRIFSRKKKFQKVML